MIFSIKQCTIAISIGKVCIVAIYINDLHIAKRDVGRCACGGYLILQFIKRCNCNSLRIDC